MHSKNAFPIFSSIQEANTKAKIILASFSNYHWVQPDQFGQETLKAFIGEMLLKKFCVLEKFCITVEVVIKQSTNKIS